MATNMTLDERAQAVRSFNRFYTRQIGLLRKGYLESPFSLTEMRVLYELAHRDGPTAKELSQDLDLDPGYLSRMLLQFEKRGFLTRRPSEGDGRERHLSLTSKGRDAFDPYEVKSQQEVASMLVRLAPEDQARLIDAMKTIENLLA
jgi:DNA-binding MarR family transcriptional regulator